MKILILATASLVLSTFGAFAHAAGAPPEGLVANPTTSFHEAFLRPGADLRPYTKVFLKPAQVAFETNWLREVNRNRATLAGRITEAQADAILESARAAFDESWAAAFRSAGYQVVASPGEGVLQLSPRVVDLHLNAPGNLTTGTEKSYVRETGVATLLLELRDSRTGAIIGEFRDRRPTRESAVFVPVDSGSNERDLGQLFAAWAGIASRGLVQLTAQSPLPPGAQPR